VINEKNNGQRENETDKQETKHRTAEDEALGLPGE
jgi:hypothetical protein